MCRLIFQSIVFALLATSMLPMCAIEAASEPAATATLRGLAVLAAAARLKPDLFSEGSPPIVEPGFARALFKYAQQAYPEAAAAPTNEFARARLQNRAISDIRAAIKQLPAELIFQQIVEMSVSPYDMNRKVLEVRPPMGWANDFPSLYVTVGKDTTEVSDGKFNDVRILLRNVRPGNLSIPYDPSQAERFVSLLAPGRNVKVFVRYKLTGVKLASSSSLEAQVLSITAYPDDAKSMSVSLLGSSPVSVVDPRSESKSERGAARPALRDVESIASDVAAANESDAAVAISIPASEQPTNPRQAATALIAAGRSCEAIEVLRNCSDRACQDMSRYVRFLCQR